MKIPLIDLKRQHQALQAELEAAVQKVLVSGSYIMGENVKAFEKEFADYIGVKHAIAVGNGTDALVITLKALGIGPGDEVITSPFTFFATAESISAVGAKPVFVDVRLDSFNLDEMQIEAKINHKTKAILPVHIFGQPCEMDIINDIAAKYNLYVIEDACQAVSAEYKGKKAGALADIACFSFFPTKNLGCAGDGGMITTDKERMSNNLKVIYTAHGFHFIKGAPRFKNLLFIFLEKLAGKWTDYLIVINKDDHEAALKYRIINSANLLYISGIGLDSKYYDPDMVSVEDVEEVRNELGLGNGNKYFLMVGEFNKNKCQSESVQALYSLNNPTIHIVFAGEGSTMSSVRELGKDLGIADRIHFLGYRKDVPRLIKGSLALLLTSRREGLPRCILEAMSLEVPVIATDIRGSKELLADGAGILYQPGNIEDLRKAMDYIINNPEEAALMGSKGRKQVLEKYEIDKIIQLHESLYKKLCEK